jgi:hypothetical protein
MGWECSEKDAPELSCEDAEYFPSKYSALSLSEEIWRMGKSQHHSDWSASQNSNKIVVIPPLGIYPVISLDI